MSKADKAASICEEIARDDSHGYLWGGWGPDYDCGHLIIYAYEQAGVPVKSKGASYTGNMKRVFLSCGFKDVTSQVNLKTGAGLRRGDVLVNEENHAAIYVGNGKIVQARSNLDGKPGDSSGQEIREQAYYNYNPWDCVLRYTADSSPAQNAEIPVQEGNEKTPHQSASQTASPQGEAKSVRLDCKVELPTLRYGDKNGYVTSFQQMLLARGYSVGGPVRNGREEPDGDFGPTMRKNVIAWQKKAGLSADGIVGEKSWSAMLAGK